MGTIKLVNDKYCIIIGLEGLKRRNCSGGSRLSLCGEKVR